MALQNRNARTELADHLLANLRYAEFNIFDLLGYVELKQTSQRAVCKVLKRLEECEFLQVTGKVKLEKERVFRIVYRIRSPEFDSFAEWRNREVFNPGISTPKDWLIVHRME